MKYFNDYQQIVRYVLKHNITSVKQLLKTIGVHVLYIEDYNVEQQWINNHVDGTFGLLSRLIMIRADLSTDREKLAILHECCHILLGHKGNFKLSSLPQSGSPEEHEANMGTYALLMIFRYHATSEIRNDYEEIADTYDLPHSELNKLREAHNFINMQIKLD